MVVALMGRSLTVTEKGHIELERLLVAAAWGVWRLSNFALFMPGIYIVLPDMVMPAHSERGQGERAGVILGVVSVDICVRPCAPCGSALRDVYPQLCNFTLQLPCAVAILESTVVARQFDEQGAHLVMHALLVFHVCKHDCVG